MAFSINDLNYEKDSKERMPWEHYTEGFLFPMMKRQNS